MVYQLAPDDVTNSISVVVVGASIYYGLKIVRLSREYEFVALRGGRAPYFIVIGLAFLELDRVFDALQNSLSPTFGALAATFNDPPAALAGFFILLGLREMYVVYRKEATPKKKKLKPQEIWKTEMA